MRLLVTRPEPDASAMRPALEVMGYDVILEPLLKITYLPVEFTDLEAARALIVTSRNGLRALSANKAKAPALLQVARQKPIFVVGSGTEKLAREMGFSRIYRGAGTASDLPVLIGTTLAPTDSSDPIVQLAGATLAFDLSGPLAEMGLLLHAPAVYRAEAAQNFSPTTRTLLQSGKIDGVLLMSPRSAGTYVQLVNKAQLTEKTLKMTHFCLSEQVADRLDDLGKVYKEISLKPNLQEMLALMANTVAKM